MKERGKHSIGRRDSVDNLVTKNDLRLPIWVKNIYLMTKKASLFSFFGNSSPPKIFNISCLQRRMKIDAPETFLENLVEEIMIVTNTSSNIKDKAQKSLGNNIQPLL